MTELTKHHERVIEAAIEHMSKSASANPDVHAECDHDLYEAVEALQASQQPKIDLAIKDLPVGADIMVSHAGEVWSKGVFIFVEGDYVECFHSDTLDAESYKYAKLSPTAKTHLIWHENTTGEIPCDGEQMVIGEYASGNLILDGANRFTWCLTESTPVKRYCILN